MKQTEIGLMPDDWEVVTIGDKFNIQQGKQVSKKNREGNNQKPFLRTANVFWDGLDLSVLDKMHFNEKEEEKFQLLKNDLLVCEGGDIGRTSICDTDLPGIYYQNHLFRLRPRNDKVEPRYFSYWMNYFVQHTEYYGSAGNKTTIPNLSQSRLRSFHFPKPDVSEQQSISHILTLIQSAIQKQEQIIRTTTELKNALMQKLFTEGTKGEAQKQTEIGLIPESWEVKKIGDIGSNFIGGGTPSTKNDNYWIGDIHWTTSKRLTPEKIYLEDGERRISKTGLKNSSSNVVPKNNLIVSTRVTVGKVAINLVDLAISQDLTGILIDRKKYCPEFLAYQILTERVQKIFEAQKRGATIKGITREDMKDIGLAIPKTRTEQEEVANSLMVFDKKLQLHQTKKQTLTALFRSMLHQLMTGQIRVKDMEFSTVSITGRAS